jgi:hypothetical protein
MNTSLSGFVALDSAFTFIFNHSPKISEINQSMEQILVKPKNQEELELVVKMCQQMRIKIEVGLIVPPKQRKKRKLPDPIASSELAPYPF